MWSIDHFHYNFVGDSKRGIMYCLYFDKWIEKMSLLRSFILWHMVPRILWHGCANNINVLANRKCFWKRSWKKKKEHSTYRILQRIARSQRNPEVNRKPLVHRTRSLVSPPNKSKRRRRNIWWIVDARELRYIGFPIQCLLTYLTHPRGPPWLKSRRCFYRFKES